MAMALNVFRMGMYMKANTPTEKFLVKASMSGVLERCMMAFGNKDIKRDMAYGTESMVTHS